MQQVQSLELPVSSTAQMTADDEAEYRSDSFRMNHMKVLPCSKRFVHDWTECPFAHPQEKARRRDPRVHNYTGIACPSMKKEGCCAFGDHCPYAHNVFEYWLHPTRYRTQLCNDGSNCKRKICFFAHSLDELRVPACKPFVSPEALAAAAAAAAADAEAKRKAATVGSPLSAFAAVSPGPSPQRSSLDALRAAGSVPDICLSGSTSSVPAPLSPNTADEATMGSSPANVAVHKALQQLTGAGFSSKDQQVIELVTSLLAQDHVSPEQAASILQQMLPPDALSTLQARLNTPRGSTEDVRCYSDPLGYRSESAGVAPQQHMRPSSFVSAVAPAYQDPLVASQRTAAAMLGHQGGATALPQQAQQVLSLEHMAAIQAAQNMGMAHSYNSGGIAQYQVQPQSGMLALDPSSRQSLESARSSFDTGAEQLLAVTCSSCGSDDSTGDSNAPPLPRPDPVAVLAGSQRQMAAQEPAQPHALVDAAMWHMSAEQVVGSAAALAKQQQQYHQAVVQMAAAALEQTRRAALQAMLLQRQQQAEAGQPGKRFSEDSSRMSFEQRGSMDLGTPRGSLDATYPLNLTPSGSLPGQLEPMLAEGGGPSTSEAGLHRSISLGSHSRFYSGQLSSVPEQFPMINAPPPSSSWNAGPGGRFSYDSPSAAERLSQDLSRMNFEAGPAPPRVAPQTANPYTSSFFAPSGPSAPSLERMSVPQPADRRPLSLPPLPVTRTGTTSKSPGLEGEEASSAAQQQQQLLLGGTALQRLQ